MRILKNSTFVLFLLAVFVAYYWYKGLAQESQQSQFLFTGFSLLLLVFALLFKKRLKEQNELIDPFISIIIISASFILLFYLWNGFFLWYSHNNSYKGNIFRGAFVEFRAPFYDQLNSKRNLLDHKPVMISCVIFLIFAFVWRKKWHNLKWTPILIGLIGLLILSFGWDQSLKDTFLANNGHYKTFASDLQNFDTIHYLLSHYTQKMGSLSVHNNHYPPGNLLLLKFEEMWWPYLSKSLIFIAALLALLPLSKLMKLWNFSKSEKLIVCISYGTSGAILFYPGIDMGPLMLPFVITGFYMMLKAFQKRSIIYSIGFAFVLAIYTFFTFMALAFILFCMITVLYKIILKEINFKQVIEFSLISFLSFVLIYWIVYLTSNFNMLECFVSSLSNEKIQVDNSEFNWARYLITSTGNILAYIGIIGIPAIGIIFHGFLNRNKSIPRHLKSFSYALITTILLLGFSNQFILEVERIWIFLTPFCLLISGWLLAQFYKEEKYDLVFTIIAVATVISASLGVSISY
jgi:hypothetical protein